MTALVEINLIGTFNVTRLAAARMAKSELNSEERGVVVNTLSIAAFDGQIDQAAYAASKPGSTDPNPAIVCVRQIAFGLLGRHPSTGVPAFRWRVLIQVLPGVVVRVRQLAHFGGGPQDVSGSEANGDLPAGLGQHGGVAIAAIADSARQSARRHDRGPVGDQSSATVMDPPQAA